MESVVKSLPSKRSWGSESISVEFYKTFEEELIPVILKLFQKIEEEKILPNTSYKANVTLILKPDKDTAK
jgi:hypothetical protein